MKVDTRQRKKARKGFAQVYGDEELAARMVHVLQTGKKGLDSLVMDLGRMLAETIMDMEREERSGPEGKPLHPGVYKWAYQPGSIYCGDQKMHVNHPRLRGPGGEIALSTYQTLKERGVFSEELLARALRGISGRRYGETVVDCASALGVSSSSVSRHFIEATAAKLKAFKERDLSDIAVFAVFIDTVHRGNDAFMVALGIDSDGRKHALGFWQGATENHEICEELLADMEARGLFLSKKTLFITDGGKGIIKALKERFGAKLLHQRCIIHKDRNIQKHLAKKYRKEAHRKFMRALEQNRYEDAKKMLLDFEKWLRAINESAADSLKEALEEMLTVHRLHVPLELAKTLRSTNPIENMFSTVRDCEGNIKRYRGSAMSQRWLASVIFYCEQGFRRIKGYDQIAGLIQAIEREQGDAVSVAA
ncbi:MAG TPA: IS256 family transposase [Syntrophorhabdales bacterium]|nr:IS256 family transposase [Syntrophorhabdales bacterium]